ncbi:hypothetical protein ACN2CC_35620 (plasmid) [Mesorhizobium muleiense]|uniref:hypothetical protein n=1 Tax=Mesorhizobium muleiense TaxID=1004279 RepID=UPI003AFA54BA
MSQNALLAIAATVGLLAGAGGTWRAMPGVEAQALSKVELTAAISADPSLCPVPQAPIVEGADGG